MALKDAFTVKVDGVDNPVQEVDIGGSSINLVVKDMIDFGDTITVSYAKPASSQITDLFGNDLADFTDLPVDNEVLDPDDTDPPMFDGAGTDKEGFEVSISFDEDVVAAIPPNPVVQLNELDVGADTAREYRYFIEWRWSPGLADNENEHTHYLYRTRQVTIPESNWGNYIRNTTGSVLIEDLPPNAKFEIGVVSVNAGGQATEVTDTAETPTVIAGTTPQNFRVTAEGRRLVNSNYQFFITCAFTRDPDDDQPLLRYEYRFKESSQAEFGNWVNIGTNLTFTLENVTDDIAYDVEVRMVTSIGASVAATLTETVHFSPPNTPLNFSVDTTRGGSNPNWTYQIDGTFEKPAEDATTTIDNYRYRKKLSTASGWDAWVSIDKTATSFTITGLTHTVAYDVEFEAVNHEGSSTTLTTSDIVIFKSPPAANMINSVVSKIDVMGTATDQIAWAWNLPTTDKTNVIDDVQVRTRNKTGAWGNFVSKGATGAQHALQGLADGNIYQITIRTSNSAGNTDVINEVEFNVLAKAPFFEVNVFTATIFSSTVQTIPLPDTKFIQYEYRANSTADWGPVASNGPREAPFYNAVPTNFGEFDFVSQNFEFNFVRGTSQMRIRGVGAAPTYKPLTEWATLTIPAA